MAADGSTHRHAFAGGDDSTKHKTPTRSAQPWAVIRDDPCIVTGAQGVGQVDRKTMGKLLDGAQWKLDAFTLSEPVARALTDDVAVIAYKVHEELTVDGKAIEFEAADSSTWVRREGEWVCAVHTEALAGDPFGRDRTAR